MVLIIYLVMACLVGLHISVTDAQCTSSESPSFDCTYMVTPDITDDSCLNSSLPCCNIGTYVRNSTFKSNTTFCFMNGTHHVINAGISLLVIENVFNISLIGLGGFVQHTVKDKVNEYNFTPYNDDQTIKFLESRAVIECNNTFAFVFKDIQILNMKNMVIKNCGADVTDMISSIERNESIPDISSAAVLVCSTTNLVFEYTSVQNSTGYGLVGINILHSQLNGSSFIANNQYFKDTLLQSYNYPNPNVICNDITCNTISVIYVTSASNDSLLYPGGNTLFVYNSLPTSPNLTILSSLFALGIDDSIHFNYNTNPFTPFVYKRMGTGLGVLMLLNSAYSVNITVTNSVSYRNQAYYGANFNFQENYGSSIISFQNVNSNRGISPWDGGSFYYNGNFSVSSIHAGPNIVFHGCTFSTDCSSANTISVQNIKRSIFINQSDLFGNQWFTSTPPENGFLSIMNSNIRTVNCYGGITLRDYDNSIANCSFNGTSLYPLHSSTNIADSTFANSQDSAIAASFSTLSFIGSVNFMNNTNRAQYGGALYLYYSTVLFEAPADVTFFNNSALYRGGAIYVQEDPVIHKCIFQFNDNNGTLLDPGIHLYFDYSYAGEAGNVLYGGNIEECSVNCSLAPHYCSEGNTILDISIAITYLGYNNGKMSDMIASDPIDVFACANDAVIFDTQPPFEAYPGQIINVSIIIVGQLNGASPSPVASYTCDTTCADLHVHSNCTIANCSNPPLNDVQITQRNCANYTYLVTGRDNQAYSKALYLYPITSHYPYFLFDVIINVHQCPFGFTNWNPNAKICSADDVVTKYNIGNDINTLTLLRNGTMWVGSYSKMVLAVHLHCPYDYCNPINITFRIEDEQDNQCNNNRTGVLCGGCQPNMSVVFGSTRCMACSGQQNLWLLIAFSIIGVALVTMLLLLNCTVSVGTINGLILYANIIRPGILNYYPIEDVKIFVFVSWLNLNLGIETCFYHGMDTYAKTWLQFVFPVYILLLTGAFIFASRWSSRLAHLCRQNAVAVLATLILLTYTNILETVITVFSLTKLDIGNSPADNPQVWLADGNVPYAQGRHICILIAAIIITVTFLIPYTIILLLAPWIQAKSHWKIFSWINKLKPFLDAYQAPFKDQYRYWPGVLLMVRVVLYAVFTSNVNNDINKNFLAINIVLCVYIVIATSLSVYKYWPLGILESIFVINLVFCTILYLNPVLAMKQDNVLITSTGISYVVIAGILCYHFYTQVKGSKFTLHIFRKFKRNTAPLVHIGSAVEPKTWVHSDDFNESREPLLEDN